MGGMSLRSPQAQGRQACGDGRGDGWSSSRADSTEVAVKTRGGMRSLGERMQRRNWKEVGGPTQGSRVLRALGLESSPDLGDEKGSWAETPSPGLTREQKAKVRPWAQPKL